MTYNLPCLCGDPVCARCFPSGQERLECSHCHWRGRRHEVDEGVEVEGDIIDACPKCGGDCHEIESGYGHGV